MGSNASFCRAVARGGVDKAVAVDMEFARATRRAGMTPGHIGHLVQALRFEADAAARLGRRQAVLARIVAPGDTAHRCHEGGFATEHVVDIADAIDRVPGVRFAGVTSLPAQMFDHASGKVKPTPNLGTIARAVEALRKAGGSEIEMNTPGTTSSEILPMLAQMGSTQIEPGHGLTGTTPLHAVEDLPEVPAVVCLSEVSRLVGSAAFCFGGGLYIDPVFPDYPLKAVVSSEPMAAADRLAPVEIPALNAIDYYGMIDATGPVRPLVGDSVVFGFRPQAFVTRAYVVGRAGLSRGTPRVETISDAFGRPADWPL
jgi:predicted amino acid racemase